ncbi:ABC transporter permease [Paraburkholderia sp. 22B1P]|uniref:ABC transporter permease n=1 Tax=Paraburkholderia sp. 22B1P TaxID=3080498 RepID=UPI00308676B8|nr:ABC transporter permease subunit [Paraburkholderia sp. 22B1P]
MKTFISPLGVLIAAIVAWMALHALVGEGSLASPFTTLTQLVSMVGTAEFWQNAGETLRALVYAFVLSLAGGLAIGVGLGANRFLGVVVEPILLNLYSLPKVTLYPLVLLVFGLGTSAKVAFGVMHGMIPVLLFTMNAIRQMKPVYLRSAQTMGLTPWQRVTRVMLPAAAPEISTGVRLGFSLTLLGVLIGEMFASQHGLGYLLTRAMNLGDSRTLMAVALVLIAFALTCNSFLARVERRVRP